MHRHRWLIFTLVLFAFYMAALLYWVTEGFTIFNYTLDDPYIHLKLAGNILRGHYGFNVSEVSAPSSSIIWPFLLAPFSRFSFYEYVPLFINMISSLILAAVLYLALLECKWSARAASVLTLFLLLLMNVLGLALTGLEHVLQLLAVVLIFRAIVRRFYLSEKASQWKFALLIAFAICIRYEMLVFWAAAVGFYFLRRDYRSAAQLFIVPLLPLLGFSLFLKSLGLGFLPSSVLAKTSGSSSLFVNLIYSFAANLSLQQGVILLILAFSAVFFWHRKQKLEPSIIWILAVPPLLHLLVGKFGWFYRYEVYIFLYTGLCLLMPLAGVRWRPRSVGMFVFVFVTAFWPYLSSVGKLRQASRNIRDQQGVTADFVVTYLSEPIGVNDIGMVGLRYSHYILDLWGLASNAALKARLSSPDFSWVDRMAQEHGVEVLIIYEKWIQPSLSNWRKVGEFVLEDKNVVLAEKAVAVYSRPYRYSEIRADLLEFSQQRLKGKPVTVDLF